MVLIERPEAPVADPLALTGPDKGLGALLVQDKLLTADQLILAQNYVRTHRCDLRQAILELNLIPTERLNDLAFEHLAGLVGHVGGLAVGPPGTTTPLQPDRDRMERDVQGELKALVARGTPVSELLDQIIARAIDGRATDIHIDPLVGHHRIRFRIDGHLHEILDIETPTGVALTTRIKVVSDLRVVERRHAQDGHWTVFYAGRRLTLRISTIPTANGERIVLRIHEALSLALGFSQLGLLPDQERHLRELTSLSYGAILVGGPVGAGKTTTLYCCMQHLNAPSRNLMTIEDPIEHRIVGANQVGVDTQNGITFAEGLRAILRQDPNVLMIGEIRDTETAKIGIQAALTGILVFSTIHAANTASTISTLFNYGIPGYILSGALRGILSPRLVRKICPYCRYSYPADPAELAALKLDPDQHPSLTLHRGQGCKACFHTGYLGRTGVYEIMPVTDLIREMILAQTTKEVLYQIARDEGMMTLKESAIAKVLEGTTTIEEMHRVSL